MTPANAEPADLSGRLLRLTRNGDLWLLAATLAVALAVRIVFFFGLVNVDPFAYGDAAISITRAQDVYERALVGDVYYTQYVRLTIIAPAAALYWLFGIGDWQSAVAPIAMSLALVAAGYAFALQVSGRVAATVTAFLLAAHPLMAINSTQFMPDAPQADAAGICLLAVVWLLFYEERRGRRAAFAAAAGAAFVLAFYAKATIVALVPGLGVAVLAALAWRRPPWREAYWREALWALAGALAVFVPLQCLIVWLGAEPFEDLRVLYEQSGRSAGQSTGFVYLKMMFTDRDFWPFTLLAIAGAAGWAYTARRRPRELIVLGVFIAVAGILYLYFEFLMGLPNSPGWAKLPRFFLPVEVIVIVVAGIGAGFLVPFRGGGGHAATAQRAAPVAEGPTGRIRGLRARQAGLALAVAAVAAISIDSLAEEHDYWVGENNRWDLDQRAIADYLGEADPGKEALVYVWSDDFARPLSFRLDGAGTVYERSHDLATRQRNRFDVAGLSRVTPGAYVVIVPGEQWWASVTAPAEHWSRVLEAPRLTALYEVTEPPAEAVPVTRELSPQPATGGVHIAALSVPDRPVLPGHHYAIGIELDREPAGAVSASIALACGADQAVGTPLTVEIPAGVRELRRDAFLQAPPGFDGGVCHLAARGDGGWVPGPPVNVAALTMAEGEFATTEADGWATAVNTTMSGSQGAVTGASTAVIRMTPAAPWPGTYQVTARLHDYGSGEGRITVRSGGEQASATWGKGEVGLVDAQVELQLAAGAEIEISFDRGGQDATFLDAIAVLGIPPPQP